MFVNISQIRPGPNVRETPPSEEQISAMEKSIAAQGILTPLLCRPVGADNHLEIVLGFQRYQAALKLGVIEVPIEVQDMTDEQRIEAQLAENIVRTDMHPIDIWRHVLVLTASGRSYDDIAKSLGRDDRDIRRWERLAKLSPEMLSLAQIDMPTDAQLRKIAQASLKTQHQVAKSREVKFAAPDRLMIRWDLIAERCEVERIFQSNAIFNTATANIEWLEDLFAEPGAEDQWYTLDVDKFRKLQHQALREKCEALKKQNISASVVSATGGRVGLPDGFVRLFPQEGAKRKKFEVEFHFMNPDGSVDFYVALDTKAQREAEKKLADKKKQKEKASKKAKAGDEDPVSDNETEDGDDEAPDEIEPSERAGRGSISQDGLSMLAAIRTDAVGKALYSVTSPIEMLKLLVIALASENVLVSREGYGRERFDDLAAQLVEPGGNMLPVSDEALAEVAQDAVARIIKFAGPKATGNWASGSWGEVIAKAISADQFLPRFDTAEFLATLSAEELRRLHAEYMAKNPGLVHAGKKTAKALRETLEGRLPDWRPSAAIFGAPVPAAAQRPARANGKHHAARAA